MRRKHSFLLSFCIILSVATISVLGQSPSGYTAHRVFDTKEKKFTDFEAMLLDLSQQNVIFFGEQHDDTATHRLELAILEGLARRRSDVILALEMFERDVQPLVNDYLAGKITEDEFLKGSRPWPNYAKDYKPLLEFAKAKGWKVVAGNIPRRYASQIARGGSAALEKLAMNERALIAQSLSCPLDEYYKRFADTMKEHPGDEKSGMPKMDDAMIQKMYQAQCAKDETMGESIAQAIQAAPQALVIHYNGAFHSDFKLGTAARAKSRLSNPKIKIIAALPVSNLDSLNPKAELKRADYILYALKIEKNAGSK